MDERDQQPQVVVTGVGAVTAFGAGADRLWQGAQAGEVAIRPVTNLPMDGYRTALGGEVQEAPLPRYDYPRGTGREPALDFALVAAEEAIAGCGLRVVADTAPMPPASAAATGIPATRWGLVLGSCNGGLVSGERALTDERRGRQPDWRDYLLVPPQVLADAVSAAFGLQGPVLSVNTACASGAHAIGHATELIRSGHADVMLVGGTDAFSNVVFAGFNSLQSLSAAPAAPYSADRDGLSLGEGSGMLVLARADIAAAAGAPILANVLGYGLSADGYHATAPHPEGEGAARAIAAALADAGVQRDDVGYTNGHGTGTGKNDPAEVKAMRAAVGDTVALSSTKSMIGHLLGAAGAVEGIVTVLALRDQVAPPTAGFTRRDPECDLDVVPNAARPILTDVATSNNFAFAGANACLVFGRAGRRTRPPAPAAEPVVITGLAALTPFGTCPAELLEAFRSSGSRQGADRGESACAVARLASEPEAGLTPRQRRRVDRLSLLAVEACQRALADAGLDGLERPATRVGVVLGTGLGPMESMERFTTPLLQGGAAMANPAVFPNTVYNAAVGQVAMLLGLTGVTSTATTLHAAGAAALALARDLLRRGAADTVICPAVDVLPEPVVAALRSLPLFRSAGSSDVTLAEGGFAVVLERASVARLRGAAVRAELAGYGITADACGAGRWDRRGRGVERAMRAALDMAGLRPDGVGTVWASAMGLPTVDRPELAAVKRVCGSRQHVEIPKQRLGEPLGGGAHLSTVLALTAHAGLAHPALVNSSSLSGTHVSLVVSPPRTSP